MNAQEREIQHAIRIELGREPDLTLWRNNVGLAEHEDGSKTKYGLCKGASDLIGILSPNGRMFCLEIKAKHGRPTPEQLMFIDLIQARGGFALLLRAHDVEHGKQLAREALNRARAGAKE
jgi:hypothetical protein